MAIDWHKTRIQTKLDFERGGRQIGDLRLRHSNVEMPLGYWPLPAAILAGAPGPTLLLTGGTHGDEFEGPAALMRLVHEIDVSALKGRLIVLPALNAPAVARSSRVSPLDGGNLNRGFPGDRDGGPTAQIGHLIEEVLLPCCDAAIDLHSGGKASVYANCSLATRTANEDLFGRNLALARAFSAPLIWILGKHNDDRSLNAAAARRGVPMIATELSGAGGIDPRAAKLAHDGILPLHEASRDFGQRSARRTSGAHDRDRVIFAYPLRADRWVVRAELRAGRRRRRRFYRGHAPSCVRARATACHLGVSRERDRARPDQSRPGRAGRDAGNRRGRMRRGRLMERFADPFPMKIQTTGAQA
jgi:predicted deacylase